MVHFRKLGIISTIFKIKHAVSAAETAENVWIIARPGPAQYFFGMGPKMRFFQVTQILPIKDGWEKLPI